MIIVESISIRNHLNELLEEIRVEKKLNEHSLITSEIQFDATGNKVHEVTYEYEGMLLVRVQEYSFGIHEMTQELWYNAENRKISEEWRVPNRGKVYDLKYDESENCEIIKAYDEEGDLILNQKNIFDEAGRLLKEIEAEDYVTEHKYEGNNRVLTEIYESSKRTLHEEYYFDENGNEIESKGCDFESLEETIIKRIFSETNLLLSEKQYVNGQLDLEQKLSYNAADELIELSIHTRDEVQVKQYEYLK